MNTKNLLSDSGNMEFRICPHAGFFDLKLGELWRYRDLVALFVRRDFVAQFKQTILGPAWFVLQPLLTTIMFTIVFGHIAKLSTDGMPPMLFYLSGSILWQYFANCLTETSNTFVANAHIFGKVYFPRLAVPVSIAISQILKFVLQFGFFLVFYVYYAASGASVKLTQVAFLLPVLLLLMAGLSLGVGIIFSAMTTKYRDLRFLLQFGVQLLMYGTPVIYPLSSIEGKWRFLVLANPMSPIIETFRAGFLGAGSFSWAYLGYSAGFTTVILFLGVILFTHIERTFMDTV
jgi:lipopolysaccharide transport system permease protein